MNRLLRLSPSQCIALAFALLHSNHHQIVNDARALMKVKLTEVVTFNDLNDDVIHAIVHLLSTEVPFFFVSLFAYVYFAG